MTAIDLIQTLRSQGVQLWVEGSKLKYRGHKNAVTPSMLAQIAEQRKELAEELRQAQETKTYCFWLKKKVAQCGPVCCEERPKEGVLYACPCFTEHMRSIGRWQ